MSTTYWVEMSLLVSGSPDANLVEFVEDFATTLDDEHDGEVMYTFASKTGDLTLTVSIVSDEDTAQVCAKVVGTVRSAAHGMGAHTPGWPQAPVTLSDFTGFSIKSLDRATVPC
ncbi:hypothetical protein [Mycolicibacterium vanbaalenii]|uniref:Uncharacterized protein n=1 Tax=Mycolicibacterium vanbaalenii (strain DSM 7251 / JCM 13017 / BCRC 16820 / KCTC 9966 / NRRL B-24157 / PYR-1) TaxID=350058 RepID=A1TD84_MYCVP|nr:hypothetical protein [Mycolicibacterium vanbaalenii]ABM15134.1 hypothetical protein Mvan_4357 [Mycolicibacterium vanbaalenii PYR-1]MCV7127013.1 hypothetical protein [Mycolicibacterium vanbaalenii PYR-1]